MRRHRSLLPGGHCHGLFVSATSRGWRSHAAGADARRRYAVGGRRRADPLLFVDLETTGLAGGAGTYAFLVGCAYFEPHGFRIRQYFLAAFQHERTLLDEVMVW